MAYSRWGMTNAAAQTLTGLAAEPTDAAMEAAEQELVDWLVWEPDPTEYTDAAGNPTLAAKAFGRAVAWQTAYRVSKAASADDGGRVIESEDLPDYSVQFAIPVLDAPPLAARAVRLLTDFGWRSQSGTTRTGSVAPPDFQTG